MEKETLELYLSLTDEEREMVNRLIDDFWKERQSIDQQALSDQA